MTPEEIKKIAEEYAASIINPIQIDGSISSILTISKDSAKKTFAEMYIPFLQFLAERYFIVEKSKVKALQAEILCAIMDAHNDDDMQMVAHEVLDVMPRRFAAVFGSEIGKEEE